MRVKMTVLAVSLSLAVTAPALAHHSFAAEFDGNKPVRIQGVLSKVEWTNPHSYFYVTTKDSKGNTVVWGCEGATPQSLTRQGFRKGDAKLGEKIVVDGYAAKDGAHLMDTRRIYLNGKLVFDGTSNDPAPKGQ